MQLCKLMVFMLICNIVIITFVKLRVGTGFSCDSKNTEASFDHHRYSDPQHKTRINLLTCK